MISHQTKRKYFQFWGIILVMVTHKIQKIKKIKERKNLCFFNIESHFNCIESEREKVKFTPLIVKYGFFSFVSKLLLIVNTT